MSKSAKDAKDGNRRRSFFARAPLSTLSSIHDSDSDKDKEPTNILRKRRTISLLTSLSGSAQIGQDDTIPSVGASPASLARPSFARRGSGNRGSVFGSLRSLRSTDEHDEPPTASSSRAPSVNWGPMDETLRNRHVLYHGEVQTSNSMFRKKKEYLVLTETHLVRFKSHHKAAETFNAYVCYDSPSDMIADECRIPSPIGRISTIRHSQNTSVGSSHEFQSAPSEASGDRDIGTPLRQVVALCHVDDGRPYFAIEISYLDDETNHASSMALQFGDPEEMKTWLAKIRDAANKARLSDSNPLSAYNSHLAARVVERERDYVPPNYAIYKVVQRPLRKAGSRSSSDDLSKVTSTVCFLAIGVHKVHLIPLFKSPQRASSPSLVSYNTQASYGILNITELRVSENDDTFELTFR